MGGSCSSASAKQKEKGKKTPAGELLDVLLYASSHNLELKHIKG